MKTAGRDALAHARLLSGSPVLARGLPMLAEADPLRLLTVSPCPSVAARDAARSDHASPERQVFALPDMRAGGVAARGE